MQTKKNATKLDPKKELMLDLSYSQFAGLINHFRKYLEKPAELAVHLCSEEGDKSYDVLYQLMKHYDLYLEHAEEIGYPKPNLRNIIETAQEQQDRYIIEVILMGLKENNNPQYYEQAQAVLGNQQQLSGPSMSFS